MRGMCIICTVDRTERYIKKRNTSSVLCAVLLFVLGISGMEIGRTDGVILLLLFIGFLVMDGTVSIKSACGIGRSRRSFR